MAEKAKGKKPVKKLNLDKETIRQLDDSELDAVAGGNLGEGGCITMTPYPCRPSQDTFNECLTGAE